MSSQHDHPVATSTDFTFVNTLLSFSETEGDPRVGDVINVDDSDLTSEGDGELPDGKASVQHVDDDTVVLCSEETGRRFKVERDGYFRVVESPGLSRALDERQRSAVPDGVAFSDVCVPVALSASLRQHVRVLAAREPVDHHPGSGTRVRDLVHPSLYPYVEGVSKMTGVRSTDPTPTLDRFGRPFESSRYQWLPTPFRVEADGSTTIEGYINNLDATRYAPLYDDLARLFSCALPLIESVVGYVDATRFWHEGRPDIEHEGELPQITDDKAVQTPVAPRSLRGRELQVIPKIVEYRLKQGETHEGVWHVEGMSHEHIVATCVFVLDRDDSLRGGNLSFKRPYTVEEAGRLFWNIPQSRPHVVETLVDEGTVPLGSVATPAGRVVVFPNSHIHRLEALRVAAGATEATRQVIVFWVVDPDVRIISTREVAPQQGVMSHDEALTIRLALMEERRLHKASFNPRVVSLCEH